MKLRKSERGANPVPTDAIASAAAAVACGGSYARAFSSATKWAPLLMLVLVGGGG